MKDPVRWREAKSWADGKTRALLASGEAEAPSNSQRDHIWSGLAPQVQILPAPMHATPVLPVAATGTASLVIKITLGVVLAAAVGTGVHVARSRTKAAKPTPMVRTPALHPTESVAPVASPIEAPLAPVALTPVAAKPAAHKLRPAVATPAMVKVPEIHEAAPVAPVVVSNELLEEGRRLSRARAALRGNDPQGALRLLQSGPAGTAGLAQEREALTIEALAMRTQSRVEAAKRARAFMAAYPDSPYRARLKALVFEDR